MQHASANLLLAALVHRTNPYITSDPTPIIPRTTCESIYDSTYSETAARKERNRILENHGTVHQRAEQSMMSSKAQLMAQTIDSGVINQVKEQMMLLQQFKDLFNNVQD
jgi:hypothetical protein